MGESAGEVTFLDGIDNHQIVTFRVIGMRLQVDVVKLGDKVFLHLLAVDHLLYEILSLVPPPRFVEFSKIFDDESSLFDSVSFDASGSFTFGVDSIGCFVDVLVAVFHIF